MSILHTESIGQHSHLQNDEILETALLKESQNASIVVNESNIKKGFIRVNKLQGQSHGSNSSSNVSMEQIALMKNNVQVIQKNGEYGNFIHENARPECMTPQNMTSAAQGNQPANFIREFPNANQSQIVDATHTERKTSQQVKGEQTPTRTDVMSTDTRHLDNRISDQMSTEKIQGWVKHDQGPALVIESKSKLDETTKNSVIQQVTQSTAREIYESQKLEPTQHISIFDKGNEKSEQESKPIISSRKAVNHSTAKFTCVPVTDYHKMVEKERQRFAKNSEERVTRNRPRTQGPRPRNIRLGIASADTQQIGYKGKFASTGGGMQTTKSKFFSNQNFQRNQNKRREIFQRTVADKDLNPLVTERGQFGGGSPNAILTHIFSNCDTKLYEQLGHTNALGDWIECDFANGKHNCPKCVKIAELTASRTGNNPYLKPEEQFLKRRINARSRSHNGQSNFIIGKNKQISVQAKLLSLASDLKKNILPKQHKELTSIYKNRIQKYLNLLAIHGDSNQQIVNNIFNTQNLDEDQLYTLLRSANPVKQFSQPDHRQHRFDPEILNQIHLEHMRSHQQNSNYTAWKNYEQTKQVVHPKMFEMQMDDETEDKAQKYNPLIQHWQKDEKYLEDEEDQVDQQEDIVAKNKKQLNVISANPVDRVIFRAGLGSPALQKKEKNMQNQRAHEIRRLSEGVSKDINSQGNQNNTNPSKLTYNASMGKQEYPRSNNSSPNANLNKEIMHQSDDLRIKSQADSGDRSSLHERGLNIHDCFEAVRYSVETPSENHNSTPNMFLYGPRGSQLQNRVNAERILSKPKQDNREQIKTNVYQVQAGYVKVKNVDLNLIVPEKTEYNTNGEQSTFEAQQRKLEPNDLDVDIVQHMDQNDQLHNPNQDLLLSQQANQTVTSPTPGFALSTDPNILSTEGNSVFEGIQTNKDNGKAVKTYEFHLPMHHIREEPASTIDNQRYPKKSEYSNYQQGKPKRSKKFDMKTKDDISSQMLEDGGTNLDQHSFKQLVGSFEDISKLGSASRATIGKREFKQVLCRRSQQLVKSQVQIQSLQSKDKRTPMKNQHGTSHSIQVHTPTDRNNKYQPISNLSMAVNRQSTEHQQAVLPFQQSFLPSPHSATLDNGEGDQLADPLQHNSHLDQIVDSNGTKIKSEEHELTPRKRKSQPSYFAEGSDPNRQQQMMSDASRNISSRQSKPPEFLEIAQRNFELFSKKMAESGVLSTNSDLSQREAIIQDIIRQSQQSARNSQSVREFTQDHIEVINISQAVQTSQRDDRISPRVNPMYVATHTHIPFRKQMVDQDVAQQFGEIIYEQQEDAGNLLDIRNPYDNKQQIKPINFKNNKLNRLEKQRKHSAPSGNTQKQKQLCKGYTFQTNQKEKTQWLVQKKENIQQHQTQKQNQTPTRTKTAQAQFKTFKANNELFIRIDDIIPNANGSQEKEDDKEVVTTYASASRKNSSAIASFDRPGAPRPSVDCQVGSSIVQTLENTHSNNNKTNTNRDTPSPPIDQYKQPEMVDFKVRLKNQEMAALEKQLNGGLDSPTNQTNINSSDAQLVTARFQPACASEQVITDLEQNQNKTAVEITSQGSSYAMRSQHSVEDEPESIKLQKIQMSEKPQASRSKQNIQNSDGSLTEGQVLPTNPSQPSYEVDQILKVKNIIGQQSLPSKKQKSENLFSKQANKKKKIPGEDNSTLYNIDAQESAVGDERNLNQQLSLGNTETRNLHLDSTELPQTVAASIDSNYNSQQRRTVLVGKQNEREARIQGGALIKDLKLDQSNSQQTRNSPSKKAKSVASVGKRLEANQDLMKQLIIDRQILSQKNFGNEETDRDYQHNILVEHFETLRAYEFSPTSLQARGLLIQKSNQAQQQFQQSQPLRFNEIQGTLQNYQWLFGKNQTIKNERGGRNRVSDMEESDVLKPRSRMIKTAGNGNARRLSQHSRATSRPQTRDANSTPKESAIGDKGQAHFNPQFPMQDKKTRAGTSSSPSRPKIQQLQNRQKTVGSMKTQAQINMYGQPFTPKSQSQMRTTTTQPQLVTGSNKQRLMNILSQQQRNFDADFSLTGTKISSAEDDIVYSRPNEDVLQHILSSSKNLPVVVPRNQNTQGYSSINPMDGALGSNLGRAFAFIQFDQQIGSGDSTKQNSGRNINLKQGQSELGHVQGQHYLRTNPLAIPQSILNLRTDGLNQAQIDHVYKLVDQSRAQATKPAVGTQSATPVTSVLPSSRLRTLEQQNQNDYRDEILDHKSDRRPVRIGTSQNNKRHQSIELSVPGSPSKLRAESRASNGPEKGQIVEMRVEGDNLIIGVELQSDLGEKHDYQQRAFTPMTIQNRDEKIQSVQSVYRSELERNSDKKIEEQVE